MTFSGATPTRELPFLLEGFAFNVLFMGLSEQAGRRKEPMVWWALRQRPASLGGVRAWVGHCGAAWAGPTLGESSFAPEPRAAGHPLATSPLWVACAAGIMPCSVYSPVCLCLHWPPGGPPTAVLCIPAFGWPRPFSSWGLRDCGKNARRGVLGGVRFHLCGRLTRPWAYFRLSGPQFPLCNMTRLMVFQL